MDKKKILHIVIVIVIAVSTYSIYRYIKNNNIEKQLEKVKIEQKDIKRKVDSLRIINNYLEILNKKDGITVKQIKHNITKIDSIVDNSNLTELQKLLYKSIQK